MIPHIIHRIWFGEAMPYVFAGFGAEWDRLNPEWQRREWSDDSVLPTVAAHVRARAREVIPNDWKRFKADVLRLEVLYVTGGLYVDTDIKPHLPIGELLTGRSVLVARSPNANGSGYHALTNCFIAAVPRHPFINALLLGLEDAIRDHGGSALAQMIGPWYLDRTYHVQPWPDVDVIGWADLAPWLTHYWNNQRRRRGVGIA
jgi:mannosyltransferase OCH1-like enzyme